jgi:hypothetical protein
MILVNVANSVSVASTDVEHSNQKRFAAAYSGRYGIDPNYLLTNRPYYDDDDVDTSALFFKKRQLKKKWAKSLQRSQSPYTIAFPALIRTRRWIQ